MEIEPKVTAIVKDLLRSDKVRSIIITASCKFHLQPANAYKTPCALSFEKTIHLSSLICRLGTVQ